MQSCIVLANPSSVLALRIPSFPHLEVPPLLMRELPLLMGSGLDLRLSLMPLSENVGNIFSVIVYFVISHLSVESNWLFISVYRFTFLIIIIFFYFWKLYLVLKSSRSVYHLLFLSYIFSVIPFFP